VASIKESYTANTRYSMDRILVSDSEDAGPPVSQPMPRNPAASFLVDPAHATFQRSCVA
jgi:hypothetical protein